MPTAVSLLPDRVSTCLFDLDGVLTQTAKLHAAAWKEMFDAFLLERSRETGEATRPFELPRDYVEYVDGKLRSDGVRSFLASRGIALPEGSPTTRGPRIPSTGWRTARTRSCSSSSGVRASTSPRGRSASSRPRTRRGCGGRVAGR